MQFRFPFLPVVQSGSRSCPPRSGVKRALLSLSALNFATTQFYVLLITVLILKITGSMLAAGSILFLQVLVGMLCCLFGGSLIQKMGTQRAHFAVEAIRLGGLCCLLLGAVGAGSIYLVALAAVAHQGTSVLFSILFEGALRRWWTVRERLAGNTSNITVELYCRFPALFCGLLFQSLLTLTVIACITQLVACYGVTRIRNVLRTKIKPSNLTKGLDYKAQFKADFLQLRSPELRWLGACSLMLSVPVGVVLASLGFYLSRAQPGIVEIAGMVSTVLIIRTLFGLVAVKSLSYLTSRSSNPPTFNRVAVSFFFLISSTAVLTFPLGLQFVVVACALQGAATSMFMPWMRNLRQGLINTTVPASSRAGVTGLMLCLETSGFAVGALLIAATGGSLSGSTALSAIFAVAGAACVAWKLKPLVAQPGTGKTFTPLSRG